MIISIKVFPSSSKEKIIARKSRFDVFVKSPARSGLANKQTIKVVAEYFKVNPNLVKIISGKKSSYKKILV